MLGGYTGKILRVNLKEKRTEIQELDETTAKKYIGGVGLAARILWEETTASTEPLSPENPLVFMVGPVTGTIVPSSSRYSVAALSPLTGIWGESHAGGFWGYELKHAGFDGIILTGKADRPSYLWVKEGKAEIRDASHLWGRNTYEVSDLIQKETDKDAYIAAIGPAGEKLVKIACIMNDGKSGRAAARCGLGAVMGSKNLKAIAVRGTEKPRISDEEKLRKSIEEELPKFSPKSRPRSATWFFAEGGGIPVKNWQRGIFEGYYEKCFSAWRNTGKPYYCKGCRTGCSESKIIEGDRRRIVAETLQPLGSNCLIDNLEALSEAYEICNRYGMDGISTGGVIAFAMECFDKGLISKSDTDGLELCWGNHQAMVKMVRKIAEKQGFGILLGEGVKRAAEQIGGIAPEYAIHVKGLEFPQHDPRSFNSLAVGYATANRGACHLEGHTYAIERSKVPCPELGFPEISSRFDIDDKGEMNARYQDFMCLLDSLVSCHFLHIDREIQPSRFVDWLNCVTGWDMTFPEFIKTGERIFTLKRMINVRRGISRKDDTLPPRMLTHSRGEGKGRAATNIPWLGKMLKDYYNCRGWSEEGIPTREKLTDLGLDYVDKSVPINNLDCS